VDFFAALAFVGFIAVMVLLAKPPAVIVAIIAVVVVGVLLSAFLPGAVRGRLRRRPPRIVSPLAARGHEDRFERRVAAVTPAGRDDRREHSGTPHER
jgi:hypothetical protein